MYIDRQGLCTAWSCELCETTSRTCERARKSNEEGMCEFNNTYQESANLQKWSCGRTPRGESNCVR